MEWYLLSEKLTRYHKDSVELLKPYTDGCKTVLDIGCGGGGFSLEFAEKGFEVTAIDKSPLAVESLTDRAKNRKLENLEAVNVSFEDYDFKKCYDVVILSYMMGLVNESNIDGILKRVNKHLILVLPLTTTKSDFAVDELYHELGIDIKNLEQLNYLSLIKILDRMNIKYEIETTGAEFGQPFNTCDEAVNFIYHYFNLPTEYKRKVAYWLNMKLLRINDLYYLPNNKKSVMIII